MKDFAWHRPVFAAFLLLPMVAGTAARADSEGTKTHTESNHQGGGEHHDGEHHDINGDGHNDDASAPTPTTTSTATPTATASSVIAGIAQPTTSSGAGDGQHRRFGDIVASPILDIQATKDAIAQGKAASMPLLLAYLSQYYPGQVLDVKLHNASDGYIYEVRYLSNAIILRTLFLDAATLKAK